MVVPAYELHAAELLIQIEEAIGQLYLRYAEIFPDQADFWREIAREEDVHVTWVRTIREGLEVGTVRFKDGRCVPEHYRTFLDYIQRRRSEALRAPLTFFEALSIAQDLESSIIERSFQQIFQGNSAKIQQLLHALDASTEKHLQRVKVLWAINQPKKG
ncbi:MAG: hypothetical protein ACYDBB_17865 [Armatimonadota bacterium]